MTDIRVDLDVVNARVSALNQMFDQLETSVQGLNDVLGLQSTATWTDIPACATFASQYGLALTALSRRLSDTWQKIREQAETLRAAAAELTATDEATQDDLAATLRSLDALVARAEAGPVVQIEAPRTGSVRAV